MLSALRINVQALKISKNVKDVVINWELLDKKLKYFKIYFWIFYFNI